MQLIEKTAIQGGCDLRNRWIGRHVITSRIFEGDLPIITTRAMNLGPLAVDPSILLDHPPSLSSTNVQRTYGINISLRVEAEGCDMYKVWFDLDSVELLPAGHFDTTWKIRGGGV
ncbi:hypothetical protein N7G274_006070 [Stereocaulon virgatum]|uniref:Uncharacterized protein n=1 Tax=Stereocaulon virgatum TaxID=373712 RepID=A0ABR4A6W2_9LECA